MEWLTFIGSILGGLIGGLFTFFGVRLTIKHDERKRYQEKIEKAEQEKPRLEIVSCTTYRDDNTNNSADCDCNVIALGIMDYKVKDDGILFFYNELALDDKNLIFVEYEFVNTGQTEIEDIYITSNLPRSMALFDFEMKDNFIKNHLLNYEAVFHNAYIKPNGRMTLKIHYVKDQIPSTVLGSPQVIIWLRDVNGIMWSQILNAPFNEIEISKISSWKEYKESKSTKKAIDCFKNPLLW